MGVEICQARKGTSNQEQTKRKKPPGGDGDAGWYGTAHQRVMARAGAGLFARQEEAGKHVV